MYGQRGAGAAGARSAKIYAVARASRNTSGKKCIFRVSLHIEQLETAAQRCWRARSRGDQADPHGAKLKMHVSPMRAILATCARAHAHTKIPPMSLTELFLQVNLRSSGAHGSREHGGLHLNVVVRVLRVDH